MKHKNTDQLELFPEAEFGEKKYKDKEFRVWLEMVKLKEKEQNSNQLKLDI